MDNTITHLANINWDVLVLAQPNRPAVGPCSAAHCSAADAILHQICKDPDNHLSPGTPVLTRDENGPCTCTCSCLALDTPVATKHGVYRAIQDYALGDMVLAAGEDLNWKQVPVKYSAGTTSGSKQPFSIFVEYGDGPNAQSLIVTQDHLFLLPDGSLKRADRLTTRDQLVKSDGSGPVAITSVITGDFYGGFHHIATSTSDPGNDLTGHLLDTQGVVSADYAVQIFHKSGSFKNPAIKPEYENLAIVGSSEYLAANGSPKVLATNQPLGSGRFAGTQTPSAFGTVARNTFVQAIPTTPPADAASFLSTQDAQRIAAAAPMRAFNDPLAQYWADQLIVYYKYFYDDVSFTVDWASNEVNAYAWQEASGLRRVDIKGGLVRTAAIGLEAIALVIAHELGHHFGGPPAFPSGLSCEGQADYYGASTVMRKVWFGEFYITMMDQAINQMKTFFGFLPATAVASAAGCSHPPGPCRIDTYKAAVALLPKPACAG